MTSISPGKLRMRVSIWRAAVLSAFMSPLWSVYWYKLFDARPPIEIAGGFWMNVLMSGTLATDLVRSRAIWSALRLRWSIGLRSIVSCPWFAAAVVPTDDVTDSTSGSFVTAAATSCWCWTSASYDTPSAASVVASSCPVSSVGKSPLGVDQKRYAVATRMTNENASVSGRRSMTQARVRSYSPSHASKKRSLIL